MLAIFIAHLENRIQTNKIFKSVKTTEAIFFSPTKLHKQQNFNNVICGTDIAAVTLPNDSLFQNFNWSVFVRTNDNANQALQQNFPVLFIENIFRHNRRHSIQSANCHLHALEHSRKNNLVSNQSLLDLSRNTTYNHQTLFV